MKSVLLILHIIVLTVNALGAQVSYPNGTIIYPANESDPHWKILRKEIKRITKDEPTSPAGMTMRAVGRIEGKAIQTLFPNWQFYYFSYSGYKKEGFDNIPVHIVGMVGHALAISSDSSEPVYPYPYGDFLIKNKAAIHNSEEAKLAWDAFCEIQQHQWKNYKIEKVASNEWKLGIYSYDQTISVVGGYETVVKVTHYKKVITDPITNQILSWEDIVKESDKRLRPAK